TLEDVIDAVGDHLQSYVEELHNDVLNKTCQQLLQFLHGENLPKAERHGATTKKLEQAVDMAAENQNFAEMESIWKLQARDVPTSVDKKKLGKAENRIAQKAEQRESEPVVHKKRPECTATATQAPIRDTGTRGANSKDVKLESVDISIGTKQLLSSADLTMAYGRRYGLVGRNGIGKTTLLKMISSGQLRIPSGINLLAVEQEVVGDDTRVIDSVLASDTRRQAMIEKEHILQARLNKEHISESEKNKWNDELSKLYTEMEHLQLDKAPARAASILYGLGFTPDEQKKPTKRW
ncbi:hypothetical protein OESDEN_17696, partial [Oesophagostomum dentatum]